MGLWACVKSLSSTGVYRIRVLRNECNLNCFESWGTTANRTLGLVFYEQTSLPNMMCIWGGRKSSVLSAALLGCISSLPVKEEKGSIALKSDFAGIKSINTLQRHPKSIPSAPSQDWKKSTTLPKYMCLYLNVSNTVQILSFIL